MKKGALITFEGGDGSGKSTQIQRLHEYLESEGYQVLQTREPGGTQISEAVRKILLDPQYSDMDPMTECMLYAAARAQLVAQVIRPAIEKGVIVICDRFVDSSIAYQAFGRNLGDAVMQINNFGIGECMPDLTIYLALDPDLGKNRISGREQDRIESESGTFHHRVWQGYEELCRMYPERIRRIDARGSIEDIEHRIRTEVKGVLARGHIAP